MWNIRRKTAAIAASVLVAGAMVAATETSASAAQDTAITSVAPGKPIKEENFKVRGTLRTEIARPVTLQRKTSSGWKTIKTSTSSATGRFTFTTSTSAKKTYRVRAPKATVDGKTYKTRTSSGRTVTPVSQTATVTVNDTRLRVGKDSLVIKGIFTPIRQGRRVTLFFTRQGESSPSGDSYTQNKYGKIRLEAGIPPDGAQGTYYVWVKTEAANGAPSKTSKKVSFKVVN